jgi:hypothetical protein
MEAIIIIREHCNDAIAALDKQIKEAESSTNKVQPVPPTDKKKYH